MENSPRDHIETSTVDCCPIHRSTRTLRTAGRLCKKRKTSFCFTFTYKNFRKLSVRCAL